MVLASMGDPEDQADAVFAIVDRYAADGQRTAKKAATGNPIIAEALKDGKPVTLVALPLSSWQPSTVQLEQVAPRVRGL